MSLEDIRELDPTLGRSLQSLLDYDEAKDGPVEDVFALTFEVQRASTFDEKQLRRFELKSDGANIAVTGATRAEYVQLYVELLLNKLVKERFEHFNRGFHKVVGGSVLVCSVRLHLILQLLQCESFLSNAHASMPH